MSHVQEEKKWWVGLTGLVLSTSSYWPFFPPTRKVARTIYLTSSLKLFRSTRDSKGKTTQERKFELNQATSISENYYLRNFPNNTCHIIRKIKLNKFPFQLNSLTSVVPRTRKKTRIWKAKTTFLSHCNLRAWFSVSATYRRFFFAL